MSEPRQTFDAMKLFRASRELVVASQEWLSDGGEAQAVIGFRKMANDEIDAALAKAERIGTQVRCLVPSVDNFVNARCFARPKAGGLDVRKEKQAAKNG